MAGSQRASEAAPNTDASTDTHSVLEIIDQTSKLAVGDKTAFGDVVSAFGHVSYSALILVPALLIVTPLSGIPLASSFCGLSIALVSLQVLIGRHHLWFPAWLLRREIDSDTLRNALAHLRRPAAFVDRHTRERLVILIKPPARTLLQATCFLCGLVMPLLEFIPFSSSILGAAVSLFATALVVRDGLLTAIGLLLLASTGVLIFQLATN